MAIIRPKVVAMLRRIDSRGKSGIPVRAAKVLLSNGSVLTYRQQRGVGVWVPAPMTYRNFRSIMRRHPELVVKGNNINLLGEIATFAPAKTTMSCARCGKTISIRPEPYCVSCHNERKFAVGRTIILD